MTELLAWLDGGADAADFPAMAKTGFRRRQGPCPVAIAIVAGRFRRTGRGRRAGPRLTIRTRAEAQVAPRRMAKSCLPGRSGTMAAY